MSMKLQIRRGKKASLPALAPGELGLCTDTGEVFIGSENGNLPVGGAAGDMLKSVYDTNGDGIVDKAASAAAVPWAGVTGKPAAYPATAHTHTKSQITDMPTSLPANGGNADTVDGKHANEFATAAQGAKADAALQLADLWQLNRKVLDSGITLGDLTAGHYVSHYSANTFSDLPSGADSAFILDVDGIQAWGNTYLQQFLTDNNGKRFWRRKSGDTWTDWKSLHYDEQQKFAAPWLWGSANCQDWFPFYHKNLSVGTADVASKIHISGVDSSVFYNENTDWVYVSRNGTIPDYYKANRATNDIDGSAIKSTYIAKVDHSGNAIRFMNKNGTVLFAETPLYAKAAAYAYDRVIRFGDNSAYIRSPSNQKMYFWSSGESDRGLFFGVNGIWTLCPNTDNNLWLGTSNHRWNQIYSTQSSISTSDRNRKTDIEALDPTVALEFLQALEPVSYKMLDGNSGRTHWGLIAQDVWQAMQQVGLSDRDFAGYCRDVKTQPVQVVQQKTLTDPEDGDLLGVEDVLEDEEIPAENEDGTPKYIYGLRYEEFIPLALLGAQEALRRGEEAAAEREALRQENKALKDALAVLTARVDALSAPDGT